jgi:Fe-S-cluster containining protein
MAEYRKIPAGTKRSGSPTKLLRTWITAQATGDDINVPCGTCNACCRTARMEIDVLADEAAVIEHTLDAAGNRKLAKNPDGSCVYLVEGKCSVYANRPRACRTYDCRVPNLVFGWCDGSDAIMEEAISVWAPLETPTAEDVDTLVAIRMALSDGGLPETWQQAEPKIAQWPRYMECAREYRQAGQWLNKTFCVEFTSDEHGNVVERKGKVISVTPDGKLVIDFQM